MTDTNTPPTPHDVASAALERAQYDIAQIHDAQKNRKSERERLDSELRKARKRAALAASDPYAQAVCAALTERREQIAADDAADQARLVELRQLESDLREEVDRAFAEQGREKLAQIEREIERLEERRLHAEITLSAAQDAERLYRSDVLSKLRPWGELRGAAVRLAGPPEPTPAAKILDACAAFLDAVLANGPRAEREIGREPLAQLITPEWVDLDRVIGFRGGDATALLRRREAIRRARDAA